MPNAAQEATYVHIMGLPYSGSTLLSLLLGSHSQIVSGGELRVLDKIHEWQCTCKQPFSSCAFWQAVRADMLAHGESDPLAASDVYDLSSVFQTIGGRVVRRIGRRFGGLAMPAFGFAAQRKARRVNALMRSLARVAGANVVVESSKTVHWCEELLISGGDAARVVFLVRDGRGFVESARRRDPSRDVRGHAARWVRVNRRALAVLDRVPRDRQLFLRYEDLCRDPAAELGRLCTFLHLEYEPAMLEFRKRPHHDIRGNIMRFGTEQSIVLDDRWTRALSAPELRDYERVAGKLARTLGYPS